MTRTSPFAGTRVETARLVIVLILLAACAAGGGGARSDIASLLYLRPIAALTLTLLLFLPGKWNFEGLRVPLLLVAALASLMLLQLVPLPYSTWAHLPGHPPYVDGAAIAHLPRSWHPLSVTPDFTLNSLLSLLPPVAMLVGMAALREDQRRFLLLPILSIGGISALLGMLQIADGDDSRAYLYAIASRGSPAGLLANRNHQAALLAAGFPLLRLWALLPVPSEQSRRLRQTLAIGCAVLVAVMILVVGSRGGIILALVGLAAAAVMAPIRLNTGPLRERPWLAVPILALPMVLTAIVYFFGRAVAIDRFLNGDLEQEGRVQAFPVTWQITRDFFPWGSGFGSFDPVFRSYEPDAILSPFYFNHAHNDLLELAMTGGLFALLLLIAFVAWFAWQANGAFRPWRSGSASTQYRRAACGVIAITLIGSLFDYPLRTPLISVLFAVACGWLGTSASFRPRPQQSVPNP